MSTPLFDEAGKPLPLSTRIGKGGEGEVYLLNGSDAVVKFYTITDLRTREQKVRQMLAEGLASKYPLVAFPKSLVFDKSRRFVGFTMAKVSSHKPLFELYAPGSRKAEFPQASFKFLVICAGNIARAIGSANAAGCVVGDINESGILVSPKATVTLIDADSFQVSATNGQVLHCVVGKPEYTPPEMQGKSLSATTRTENHDAFGLAVAIFLLLFMGRHPFSGRYSGGDMPLEKAISEFRFAYSLKRSVGMSPPPGVPTLKDLPAPIADAFEVAFGPSGVNQRPAAKQWIALLDDLRASLKVCAANSLHEYSASAPDCPWCRMEKRFLTPLFLPKITDLDSLSNAGPAVGDVVALWAMIQAVQAPPSQPFPFYSGGTPDVSDEIKAIAKGRRIKQFAGFAIGAVGVGTFMAGGPFLAVMVMTALALYLIFARPADKDDLKSSFKTVQTRLYEAENEWSYLNSAGEFHDLKSQLQGKKAEYDALPATQQKRLDEYARNRRSIQMEQHLDRQLIRNHNIPKIGKGREATLLSYGIESAADVREAAVLAVPGFGPKTAEPLLLWRRQMEAKFVYNPSPNQADIIATNAIKSDINQRAAQLKAELSMGPARLRQLAAAIPAKRSANISFIELLQKQKAQLGANIEALGMSLPQVERPPAKVWTPIVASQPVQAAPNLQPAMQSSSATQRCPKCGGSMVIRLAMKGVHRGNKFYGCTRYPACNGTRSFP